MIDLLRKCRVCGLEAYTQEELKQFKYNKPSKFHRQNLCKKCDNTQTREWQTKNQEQYKNQKEIYQKKHKIQHRVNSSNWKTNNSQKVKAYAIALNSTKLKDCCEDCGSIKSLERHHPDYNKPLEVVTLCKSCHMKRHRRDSS